MPRWSGLGITKDATSQGLFMVPKNAVLQKYQHCQTEKSKHFCSSSFRHAIEQLSIIRCPFWAFHSSVQTTSNCCFRGCHWLAVISFLQGTWRFKHRFCFS